MNHNINNILTNVIASVENVKLKFSWNEVAITTFVCMTPINRTLLCFLFNIVLVVGDAIDINAFLK